jgi:hypothetical protein
MNSSTPPLTGRLPAGLGDACTNNTRLVERRVNFVLYTYIRGDWPIHDAPYTTA